MILSLLVREVREALQAIHDELGSRHLLSVYDGALCYELRTRGLSYTRNQRCPVLYRGVRVGIHRLDLVVAGTLLVELRQVPALTPLHARVVLAYLEAAGLQRCVLVNFAAEGLELRELQPRRSATVGLVV
ncbi:MAG: GxxExxY protein [Planctomycetes bacterium]|nr:GxxExxY protein [Planctomycetota bacterium]